jgi:hypothetical protein
LANAAVEVVTISEHLGVVKLARCAVGVVK